MQSGLTAATAHEVAASSHRAGDHSRLIERCGLCSFAMNPQVAVEVAFADHVVVIGFNQCEPINSAADDLSQRLLNGEQHRSAIGTRVPSRPSHVMKVSLTGLAAGREASQSLLTGLPCAIEVPLRDCLPDAS